MRYVVYGAAGVGLMFLFAVLVGKCIALGNRRVGEQRYTVVWRDTDVMKCAYTGTLTYLGAGHICVEGADGPVVIAKEDVLEVMP